MKSSLIFAVLLVHNTLGVLLTPIFALKPDMKLRSGRILRNDNDDEQLHDILQPPAPPLPTNTTAPGPDNITTSNTTSPISACGECITCERYLDTNPVYSNHLTNETFTVTEKLSCQSEGVIYLIRCAHPGCTLQYVGQTINTVNKRCSGHRSGILHNRGCKFITYHFNKVHKPSDLRITPLCSIPMNKSDPTVMRKNLITDLRKHENELILKLNTLYPYGLNDRLEKPLYVDTEKELLNGACIYKLFPKVTSTRTCRGSGKSQSSSHNDFSDMNLLLNKLHDLFTNGNLHECRTIIASLKLDNIINLGKYLRDSLSDTDKTERWCMYILIDLSKHYRNRSVSYHDYRNNNFSSKPKVVSKNVEYVPINFI